MRKDASFWKFNRSKFEKIKMHNQPYFQNIPKICARMTHLGENIEIIEYDPLHLMLPSDSNKNVSILNYRPLKFQSYENCTRQT